MVQSKAAGRNALHELGYKIFLDRYAQKDMTRSTLAVGDTVIVVVDSKTGQREIGRVTAMHLPKVTVELLDGETVERDVEHVDKPLETDPGQMMDRVAAGIAAMEATPQLRQEWTERFRWLLEDWKFVPAGRILTAAGTDQELTYYNCMPPEQEILTAQGYRPLGEVRVGDLVVTHRSRLRPVLHKFERETQEPLYTLRFKAINYDDLRLTGDHKVYSIRADWVNQRPVGAGLRLAQPPDWIPAKDLKPGDYVAAAYNGEECPPDPIFIEDYLPQHGIAGGASSGLSSPLALDADLCYLFGRWMYAGGVIHRVGTGSPAGIRLAFDADEQAEADRLAALIAAKFDVAPSVKPGSSEDQRDLWADSAPLGAFFKAFLGAYAYDRRIPDALMHLPQELTLALLRGLFSAGGSVSGDQLSIILPNRALAVQAHQLLLRLGCLFSVEEDTGRSGRAPAYRLQAAASECPPLFEQCAGAAAPANAARQEVYIEHDGLKWVRIADIQTETYTGTVIDIEVAEDHSFVSAGVVVSNCYVIPSPRDSRGGIIETLRQMTEIMSRGGGVGINISSLRPRHAYVKGVNGRSSGAVSWGALYSFVTGLIEQGGCFGPDERIATDKGLIPAAELAARIEAGEALLAQTHKGLRRITARFRNGIKPLFEVTTARGYRVRITEDHKVAVLMDGQIVTMALKYLRPGDEILTLLGQGVDSEYVPLKPVQHNRSVMSTARNEAARLPAALDENLAYLLGYMHGDGCVHMDREVNWQASNAIKMTTSEAYPNIRQRLIEGIERVFGIRAVIEAGDGAAASVSLYSRLVVEWLNQNGLLKAKTDAVRVPESIFRSPSPVVGAFIAGYFDADGCNRGGKSGFGIDSISRDMLGDIQQLLAANGIVSRISAQDRSAQGWRTRYRLTVTGSTFKQRFVEFVPAVRLAGAVVGQPDMCQTYPAAVYTALGTRAKYRQRIDDGVSQRISARVAADGQAALVEVEQAQDILSTLPDRIAAIRPLGDFDVYDFEVDDVHLLSGGGVYTSNSRRGALMLILNDWHPDVFNFISSKRTAGQITNANISVGVSDKLIEAVKADGDWTLMFPDTSDDDYDESWDGDLEKWIAAGRRVIEYRTVKAREVWNAIIESAWASAEPGVWFIERTNKMSNSYYYAKHVSTNPCVTGDTLVATESGYTSARDLKVGMRIRTPAGLKPIEKVYNNGVQRIYRVEFSDGGFLECTADHKLKVVRGKKYEWAAVSELRAGDKILVSANKAFGSVRRLPEEAIEYIRKRELNVSEYYDRTLGFLAGVVLGDGMLRQVPNRNSYQLMCRVAFGAAESDWLENFQALLRDIGVHSHITHARKSIPQAGGQVVVHQSIALECSKLATLLIRIGMQPNVKAADKVVPQAFMSLDREFLAGLLDGLFTTDGNVNIKRDNPMLRFSTASYELAQQVRLLLLQFGIHGRVYAARRDENLADDGRSMFGTGVKYDVVVMNEGIARFHSEIGLSHPQKAARLKDAAENWHCIGGTWTASVVSIQDTERDEEVFDVYEPDTLIWVTNGYVSLDCGEQPLPGWAVCNLGAINLARFYDPAAHDVKWDDLERAARYATRFLDNVIDTTPYFFEDNQRQQMSERRVGLNNMGLAELMIHLGIRYGSDESVAFIDRLYGFIARVVYETSIELAQEKGAFPQFDADKFVQSGFMQSMPEDIRQKVQQHGIRNVTLLTQAPTGTTGTMVNTSTGIEPFFSWVYFRKSRLGLHEEQVPLAKAWFDAHPGETKLPDYFVTAMDLAPEEHVRVQAAIQRWVDSSISKTANLPRDYTVEQTRALYELMYELGCKGGTVYRDGSRDEQVLMLKGDERAESEMAARKADSAQVAQVATPHRVYPRPRQLSGVTVSRKTPFGTAFITMNSDEHDNPFEVFITVGKAGSDLQADAEGMGRMISLQLRTTAPQNRKEMLKLIIDQLQGIGGSRAVGMGPSRVSSLPDAVAGALAEHFFPAAPAQQLNLPLVNGGLTNPPSAPADESQEVYVNGIPSHVVISGADICPECGLAALVRAEGCEKCLSCGYSRC